MHDGDRKFSIVLTKILSCYDPDEVCIKAFVVIAIFLIFSALGQNIQRAVVILRVIVVHIVCV